MYMNNHQPNDEEKVFNSEANRSLSSISETFEEGISTTSQKDNQPSSSNNLRGSFDIETTIIDEIHSEIITLNSSMQIRINEPVAEVSSECSAKNSEHCIDDSSGVFIQSTEAGGIENTNNNGANSSDTMTVQSYLKSGISFEEQSGGLEEDTTLDEKHTLYFRDGIRRIDLVLVHNDDFRSEQIIGKHELSRILLRKKFEDSLIAAGLQLEKEDSRTSYDQKTCFIKVHVPYNILIKYAEALDLKKPTRRYLTISAQMKKTKTRSLDSESCCFPVLTMFKLKSKHISNDPTLSTSIFGSHNEEEFTIKDREIYYTSAQRSQVAWYILLKANYGDNIHTGIRKLLNNNTYDSVFPLHEGDYNSDSNYRVPYDRRLLYLEWARPQRWYKHQPLWLVKKYFGDKIALYFAWLGFYTEMLILPSIVGTLCFIYGLATMNSPENVPSKEICDINIAGNITLCPQCDETCKYQKLKDSCFFANLTYLFDNPSTVVFSIIMSFWATSFLEMWKQKQAVLRWQWDLTSNVKDEETRPEYEASVKTYTVNPLTRKKEPFVPLWLKLPRFFMSTAVVCMMMLLVCACVLTTIIFRLELRSIFNSSNNIYLKRHAQLLTAGSGALLNLSLIIVLTRVYHSVALWLTNKENPKTQEDYERSFIYKIFLFEFMNYYAMLIYIAFIKGRFFTHPGDKDSRSSLILRLKGDVCDPAGCLSELCIQLAIIMIGKQVFNNILEVAFPAIRNWWRERVHRKAKIDPNREYTPWETNYNLQDPGSLALFEEYLEMAIQYGFVTLFVAAFPLAPLFALLNNICEIRLDAFKIVAQARRPIAERVPDIGAWYQILKGLTYCAVVFNGFVIAFTSEYIPRKMYQFYYSAHNDLIGYIDYSLSLFNVSNYNDNGTDKLESRMDSVPKTCQYRGYRNGPDHPDDPYGLSPQYWQLFAARLIFVLIFEHFVFAVTGILSNLIPNVPEEVSRQVHLEKLFKKVRKSDVSFEGEDTNIRTPGAEKTNFEKESDEYGIFLKKISAPENLSNLGDTVENVSWVRRISRQSVNFYKTARRSIQYPFPRERKRSDNLPPTS